VNQKDFNCLYPWKRNQGKAAFAEMFFEIPVPLSRAEIWPFLADTSRLNRALGLSKRFEEERSGVLHVRETFKGMKVEWIEHPWTWVHESHSHVEREHTRGPFHFFRAVFHVSDNPKGGVTMNIHFAWILKFRPLGWLLGLASKGMGKKLEKIFAQIANVVRDREKLDHPYVVNSPISDPAVLKQLERIESDLAREPVSALVTKRLVTFIKEGDPFELVRLRPLQLAREWKIEEHELLRACIFATQVGLLTLSWDIICPHCRGVREEQGSLAGIPKRGHCDVCDIDFTVQNENSVEVAFHVHESIREAEKVVYCSAEPHKKQHIKWQHCLSPGEKSSALFTLPPGKYRLRETTGQNKALVTIAAEGLPSLAWTTQESPVKEISLSENFAITVRNDTGKPANYVFEELWWERDCLRPGRIFCVPEFQRLFSRDSLSAGVQLDLGNQTIFFSDIVGSTQFYQEVGDSAAFAAVVDHFESLSAIIQRNDGAVIKTIGDAVMAAFHTPAHCLKACQEAQLEFAPGRKKVRLRVSVHYGSVIAVNWNTGKDYFGNVVNFAAKMQSCANAGEVAISEEALSLSMGSELITAYPNRGADLSAGGRSAKVHVFDLNPVASRLKLSA
jgi:class 3 adenylate cyclase